MQGSCIFWEHYNWTEYLVQWRVLHHYLWTQPLSGGFLTFNIHIFTTCLIHLHLITVVTYSCLWVFFLPYFLYYSLLLLIVITVYFMSGKIIAVTSISVPEHTSHPAGMCMHKTNHRSAWAENRQHSKTNSTDAWPCFSSTDRDGCC